ncbi:hypothetical protein I5Q16_23010 [Serratia marcescens]|nr:hypothetical protein [Serratia marcescens]
MSIKEEDVGAIYENLLQVYAEGEKALIYGYRMGSPDLKETILESIDQYYDRYSSDERRFIFNELVERIIKASQAAPLVLDDEQKKQVQRFYSTNAGASFINTKVRNTYLKTEQAIAAKYPDIRSALAAAASESVSEGRVAFSTSARKTIEDIFKLNDVTKAMRAVLNEGDLYYRASQFRGTLVPAPLLSTFKKDDVMVNAFFTSFSPDILEYTKTGTGEKKTHDGLKQALKFAGSAYKTHTGEPVIYEIPSRAGYKTITISTLYEHETVIPPGEKFKIEEINRKGTHTHILLKKVDAKEKAKRVMFY